LTKLPLTWDENFPPVIGLEPWLTGFENPTYLTFASPTPPWDGRLFITEKAGRILMVQDGAVQAAPFLDIADRVGSSSSEQGLLSVAFPPDFDTSGAFYVNYTDRRGNTVVSRFRLMETDPPQGDPVSEQKLLEIPQPAANHNGGQLQFGPDGYLYIGTGDGGRAGDPWNNAQNPQALLGKMLRIDVAGRDEYRIPSDNPFLDWPDVRSEIWALGLRNPWRFSFDRASGDLYIADVGQNAYEEIDFQPAQSTGGENYGWNIVEGNHCFKPADDCDSTGLIPPVAEYDHSLGCSITGGYVYRGARYPSLSGLYLFGDYCSGRIWGLGRAASGEWKMALLLDTDIAISSFGEDAAGELYVLGYTDRTIHRLIALP
jgi:glucose/arabinose dehydrogenase